MPWKRQGRVILSRSSLAASDICIPYENGFFIKCENLLQGLKD
jgi:hypothetical protein